MLSHGWPLETRDDVRVVPSRTSSSRQVGGVLVERTVAEAA